MMSCAYNELYLPLAQRALGDSFDFAVNELNYSIDDFYKLFIVSGMSHHFEIGNPTYVAGKNGCEITKLVIEWCGLQCKDIEDVMHVDKTPEYWIGWSLAYYQWISNMRFVDIEKCVPINEMYSMYGTLHEADVSVLVNVFNERCSTYMNQSKLKRLRAYARMSQSMLAKEADVPLRQIQLFEQGKRDINKTQSETLDKLAKALNCSMEDLLQ